MKEGQSFSERSDPFSSGLAISLFQDSIEMVVWALIKEKNIKIDEKFSFISNINKLINEGFIFPHVAKLLEINKARVNFKHYGIIPDSNESNKFQIYAEEFIRFIFSKFFNREYDDVSIVDLVSFLDVKEKLKESEHCILINNYEEASKNIGISKSMLFSYLDKHLPHVDRKLEDIDKIFRPDQSSPHYFQPFKSLSKHIEIIREYLLVSLFNLPLHDYLFLKNRIPAAMKMSSGNWMCIGQLRMNNAEECRKAIDCIVNISIKIDTINRIENGLQ
jgi:hypothetical protein